MAAKGNKCCCCGECKGVVGCCSCACKTICFSIEGEYRTFGSEADWLDDSFSTQLAIEDDSVAVSLIFDNDGYDCYLVAFADGYERARFKVGYDIFCTNLSGSFPTSLGEVSFQCTDKIKPECTTCGCLCECICVIVRDYTGPYGDYLFGGKLCWTYGEYTGSADEMTGRGPVESRSVTARIYPDEYTGECLMVVTVDGMESDPVALTLQNCERGTFSHEVAIFDGDNVQAYSVELRCAECHEDCVIRRQCCPGLPDIVFITVDTPCLRGTIEIRIITPAITDETALWSSSGLPPQFLEARDFDMISGVSSWNPVPAWGTGLCTPPSQDGGFAVSLTVIENNPTFKYFQAQYPGCEGGVRMATDPETSVWPGGTGGGITGSHCAAFPDPTTGTVTLSP
jgi:hypothetical protein